MRRPSDTTRAGALAAIAGGAALLAGCGAGKPSGIAVGSKDFTEELVLGNLYADLLERAKLPVRRRLNLGGTVVAMAALRRGDVDLYPEYTGTALLTVLKLPASGDPAEDYATMKREYAKRFDLVCLDRSPFDDTQALATTRAVADRYGVRTLAELAKAAPELRLGAIPEFTTRADGLPGLQRAYGGFRFKSVELFDIGLKYEALAQGKVDVVVAFSTDGRIVKDGLVVMRDERRFWPSYQATPVVRRSTLEAHPEIATALNRIAAALTDGAVRALNERVDGGKEDPEDVASAFAAAHPG